MTTRTFRTIPASSIRMIGQRIDPRHVADAANAVLDRLVLPDGRCAASVIVAEAQRRQQQEYTP